MGANEDFKRLAREMAEKARAQRERAARAAQEGDGEENGDQSGGAARPAEGQERGADGT